MTDYTALAAAIRRLSVHEVGRTAQTIAFEDFIVEAAAILSAAPEFDRRRFVVGASAALGTFSDSNGSNRHALRSPGHDFRALRNG